MGMVKEDLVFRFLQECTGQTRQLLERQSSSPWAACRFAHLSSNCLIEATRLEGVDKFLPPKVVSLNLVLHRVLQESGEGECEQRCRALSDVAPEGWLQCKRLKKR